MLRVVAVHGKDSNHTTMIELNVDMKRLFPVCTDVTSIEALPENVVLFELDGLYVIESVYVQLRQVCCVLLSRACVLLYLATFFSPSMESYQVSRMTRFLQPLIMSASMI